MKETAIKTLKISSDSFNNNEIIPSVYTCEGENINPPLRINTIPEGSEYFALIVEDPDAPKGVFTHWIAWNIPPSHLIDEHSLTGGIEGLNDYGVHHYMGPCPPSGTHRYLFKIYALDSKIDLENSSSKEALEKAMQGHIIAYGELIGLYKKVKEV
jgi:Raf kinase inhibitor-like YbhB/YbcL family protein